MSVFTGIRKILRKTGTVEEKRLTSQEKSAVATFAGSIIAIGLVSAITLLMGT
ncbi:hypothetical protein [Ammoniphilus sp. 3BR4]|uniref:hypothetical protein n=1 Tax=Ammoniphilus sp. 3BR4 TaxID=3158265 RepID=UPI003466BBC1